MTHTARAFAPAPGSWGSIALIYCYGVLTTASLSKIIPILGDTAVHLGASPAQFALLISLMTILPAVLASVAGSIVDRVGAHRALQIVAVLGVLVNAAYLLTDATSEHWSPPSSGNLRVGSNDDPPLNADLHIAQSDIRPLIRDQLALLRREIATALDRGVRDRMTRIHLEDALVRIDEVL